MSASHDDVLAPLHDSAEPPRRRRRFGLVGRLVRALVGLMIWSAAGVLTLVVAGLAWLWTLTGDLPDPETARAPPARPSVVYLDAHGREIARRGPVVAPPVSLEDLPPYLIDAVVAVEDRRFYDHPGVDPIGLARAAFANLRAGRVVQGGSTITQQLAKNLFLTGERTLRRKVEEMLLAVWLERRFSKDEILELYLNSVYFGAGAWGVEAAAIRYFGHSASELTLAEAAILAGLLKAPSRLAPTNDVVGAEDRAMVVLELMVQTGAITEDERDAALGEPVAVMVTADPGHAGHFVDWVAADVRALAGAGEEALIVRTTLDLSMQASAEAAIAEIIDEDARARGAEEAALIAIDGDGAVRALVGGRDYAASQFNRAVQARRQPGSAFKPFVYAAAMEAGMSPWDVREDAPIRLGDWEPANYSDEYLGDVTLITALARSINTVAVRVAEEIGRDRVARYARRMGLRSRLPATRAMALGAHEVTLDELTAAYAPFANGGFAVSPYSILEIRAVDGRVLWTREPAESRRVMSVRARRFMNEMLARVVEEGTGRAAALADREAGGKTGTTNDFRDAWFVGFVPGFSVGVWVGADDFAPMDRIVGGGQPARIWRAFMVEALEGVPARPLDRAPQPPISVPMESVERDPLTGDPVVEVASTDEDDADAEADETAAPGRLDRTALEALLARLSGDRR